MQVALDHHAHDAALAARQLKGHVGSHLDLAAVLLGRVGMRAIDHHLLAQAGLAQRQAGRFHMRRVVVGRFAAAQDDMAVGVAAGLEDRGHAHLGHAHERMRRRGRHQRVGGHLHAAVGAVLEADRAAQARRELAVALALGGARADRPPGDQVADVLRAQQVEEFGARRQAQRADLQQQFARAAQAFVDAEAAVQPRVVDVALPADRGARLLEVDAHHDDQFTGQFVSQRLQQPGVVHRLRVVVDRAGTHHHHQPVVLAAQHGADGVTRGLDQGLDLGGDGQFFQQHGRRDQCPHRGDAGVVDAGGVEGGVGRTGFAVVAGVVEGSHDKWLQGGGISVAPCGHATTQRRWLRRYHRPPDRTPPPWPRPARP